MKRSSFILVLFALVSLGAYAQNSSVKLANGETIIGDLVSVSDSMITLRLNGSQEITYTAAQVAHGKLPESQRILVRDGKIIQFSFGESKTTSSVSQPAQPTSNAPKNIQDLNYEIGKALKDAGSVGIGLGIPCLAAGLATCIAGHVNKAKSRSEIGETLTNNTKLLEASYYLFGTGAALTIIGIPLYVGGNKIMELNINFTGNGAGVTMNF